MVAAPSISIPAPKNIRLQVISRTIRAMRELPRTSRHPAGHVRNWPSTGQEQAGSARSRCGKCNYVSKKHWRRPDLKILYIVSLVIKVVYTVYTCIIQNIYDSKCFMVQTLLSSLEVMSMEHLLNDITGCDGYQNSIHVVKPLPFMASH